MLNMIGAYLVFVSFLGMDPAHEVHHVELDSMAQCLTLSAELNKTLMEQGKNTGMYTRCVTRDEYARGNK
jgi:hypothetical protein